MFKDWTLDPQTARAFCSQGWLLQCLDHAHILVMFKNWALAHERPVPLVARVWLKKLMIWWTCCSWCPEDEDWAPGESDLTLGFDLRFLSFPTLLVLHTKLEVVLLEVIYICRSGVNRVRFMKRVQLWRRLKGLKLACRNSTHLKQKKSHNLHCWNKSPPPGWVRMSLAILCVDLNFVSRLRWSPAVWLWTFNFAAATRICLAYTHNMLEYIQSVLRVFYTYF